MLELKIIRRLCPWNNNLFAFLLVLSFLPVLVVSGQTIDPDNEDGGGRSKDNGVSFDKRILIPGDVEAEYDILARWDYENEDLGHYSKDEIRATFNPSTMVYSAPVTIEEDEINGEITKVMRITNWGEDLWHGFEMKIPIGEQDEVWFSYNWKFGENYNSTHGGKLSGFQSYPIDSRMGPDCPRDGYGFICKVNFEESNRIYTYHYDQTPHGWDGCPWSYGEYDYNEITMANGTWYNISNRIVMNTFTGGVGNTDGIFEVWIDEKMVFKRTNLRFVKAEFPEIKVNAIAISNFYGGDGDHYRPVTDSYGYMDNLYVYKRLDYDVTGHNTHDPERIIETPNPITDRRFYYDELITKSGDISNSEWGNYYSQVLDEAILIDAGAGNRVILTMDTYEVGSGDYMFIYDGNTTDAELMRTFDGYEAGADEVFESTGRYMFIRLSSNKGQGAQGWTGSVELTGGGIIEDNEAPSIPVGISAVNVGEEEVEIQWDASTDNIGVVGYNVFVDGDFNVFTAGPEAWITGLAPNTRYQITITAFDDALNSSEPSEIFEVRTVEAEDLAAPSIPQNVRETEVTDESISVAWSPSSDNVGVAGYYVYFNALYHETTEATNSLIEDLIPGLQYNIEILAFDAAQNQSEKSVPLSVKTINPDQSIDPKLPEIRIDTLENDHKDVRSVSSITSFGHTQIQDFGVIYSKDRDEIEEGDILYYDPDLDSVIHQERIVEDLELFYDFSMGEGNTISDKAGLEDTFDLKINKQLNVIWQPGQGLGVYGNTTISSDKLPSRIIDRIASSNEITIEAWIKPEEIDQTGPARIFSLSSGSDSRAFTLAQEGIESQFKYVVQLNTSNTDDNGAPQALTDYNFTVLGLHHVVYIRDSDGEEKIYVNSQEVYSGTRPGNLIGWGEENRLLLGNELTGDRPWNGIFYMVALYSRALDDSEIYKNYLSDLGQLEYLSVLESVDRNVQYYMRPFVRTDQGVVFGDIEEFMIENVIEFSDPESELPVPDSLVMAVIPNPSNGTFHLHFADGSNTSNTARVNIASIAGISVYDEVFSLEESDKAQMKSFNLNGRLQTGIYVVNLVLGSSAKAQRLIIHPY